MTSVTLGGKTGKSENAIPAVKYEGGSIMLFFFVFFTKS